MATHTGQASMTLGYKYFEVKKLSKLSFGVIKNEEADVDKFCNNDVCEIPTIIGD